MSFDDEEEDLPRRPSLGADRTNNPWLVVGQGVSPLERELTTLEAASDEELAPKPGSAQRGRGRKKGAGLSIHTKCVEMDTHLFNDGPDGEEGTCFARWLAGELIVEREGETVRVGVY